MPARSISVVAAVSALLCFAGCSNYSFSRAVYEGVQTRDRLQAAPSENAGKPEPMNYQQYESERKR